MKTITTLSDNAAWSLDLDDVRTRVMIDLCFNMGWHTLSQFHTFLGLMQSQKFYAAGNDIKTTAWYGEVGNRGPRLVGMVLTGEDYTA
jgi:lysozyme